MLAKEKWRSALASGLQAVLQQSKDNNARYSLRAFARRLKIPVSTLSEILNEKPTISREKAISLVSNFPLCQADRSYLLHLLGAPLKKDREILPASASELFEDPIYIATLGVLELDRAPDQCAAIANALKTTPEKAQFVLSRLAGAGLVKESEPGVYHPSGKAFTSSDGVTSGAIRSFHLAGMDLAKRAISEIPLERRDVSTISFAGCSDKFAEMQREIRQCHERILAIAQSGPEKDVVYRMIVNLFPYPEFH